MWKTFDYQKGTIFIAAKAWSDFSANLPLIRSFSWGNNFPPQDPLFAGEPTRYHIFFYLVVGLLERIGFPLDFALNLPSAFGFFGFLVMIYLLAKLLFKSRFVGILSVVLTLFNSSFSFLEFFKIHPLSWQTLSEIFSNKYFPSFGPYDGKTVSAFWNLNIYTNQRHLAAAFGLILGVVFLIVKPEKKRQSLSFVSASLVGLMVAFLPFIHTVGFGMALVVIACLFLFLPRQRKPLLVSLSLAALIGLPQIFLIQPGGFESNFRLRPGYLIADRLSFFNFFSYWAANLGLGLLLIPLGFFKANRLAKKVFLSFWLLFLIGNLFQFSPEIAANHKFFNLFLVAGNLMISLAVYFVWKKRVWGKILGLGLIFLVTFSGIIDFFPIKNDSFITISDAPKNPDVVWIKKNTPPQAIFLNSFYVYHPASLAGRPIVLGWPYFPWAGGLDAGQRDAFRKEVLEAKNISKTEICQKLKANKIQFVSLGRNDPQDLNPNLSFWKNGFLEVYNNPKTNLIIYEVERSCL